MTDTSAMGAREGPGGQGGYPEDSSTTYARLGCPPPAPPPPSGRTGGAGGPSVRPGRGRNASWRWVAGRGRAWRAPVGVPSTPRPRRLNHGGRGPPTRPGDGPTARLTDTSAMGAREGPGGLGGYLEDSSITDKGVYSKRLVKKIYKGRNKGHVLIVSSSK